MNEAGRADGRVVCVVVTYNGMAWLDRCLGSLIASSAPVHVIVVDNGSTDGTPDLIGSAFPEVELVRTGKNLGFGAANNVGIRMALDRGAGHVFLLNQDAWVKPETIGLLVAAMTEHPEYGVLSPMHLNGAGDALDGPFSEYIIPFKCPGLYSDLVLGRAKPAPYTLPFVNAAAWLLSRKCLQTVGGFNPSFRHYGEDNNYLHRVHFHGMLVGVLPTAWIHHDRAERTTNPYFDETLVERRNVRLAYADPNRNLDAAKECARLRAEYIKSILLLRRTAARIARARYRLITSAVDPELTANRSLSRKPGSAFLAAP